MTKKALIVGVSGIVGGNLADRLIAEGDWTIFGVARRPGKRAGITPIAVDLQDPGAARLAIKDVKPSHVFLTTWLRQPT